MTQPTIELVHELRNGICALWHRLAEMNGGVVNAGRIKDEEKLVGLLLNHCNQIRSALTAQAGDGNRLPLEEVPEGWWFYELCPGPFNQFYVTLIQEKTGVLRTAYSATPAEALRAAIAAAKGE